ncbi:MAG: SurA N-terminal domain-containing protein [Rikenellaceae bacterium]|nr:SurA N-terminal domain-containing protein [Rikenellaceae bacterium]
MATLNTLRTRGGIIVSVVIGIALLSFLLGDFGNTGAKLMNDRKMKVGTINGEKIGYAEFADKVDVYTKALETMYGSQSLSAEQQENVKNQVWQALVMQYAWEPGFEQSGLQVSENEQIDMVDGSFISPVIRTTFTNPNTGTFDPAIVRNFVTQIDKDPTAALVWNFIKDQMIQQRYLSKYITLVAKGMYVTDLEVEQGVANSDITSAISYIVKDYSQVADSTIDISQAEVKKYYDAHKNIFRQTASRDIEYVLFDVLPSDSDYVDAEKHINEIAAEFAVSETPLQYATLNSQNPTEKRYFTEDQLPAELAAFAFGANSNGMYGPTKEGDMYTMARVADSKMLPDSVGARHILIGADQKATADSILNALKGGASFAELSATYSQDPGAKAKDGDLGVFQPEQMVPEFSEAVLETNKGDYFTVQTQFGIHVGQVTYKSEPKKKVQLATITYKIEPSETTQQTIYANASKFISEAAGSYENFEKAATDNSLSKRVVRIKNTDRNVSGINNSREIVRWAYNGNKGDVSAIMEVDGNYVIAAITGVSEDGIAPLETVSPQIVSILREQKKGEILAQEMTGSSLAEVASKLNLEVKEAANIDFNSFYIESVGVEPKLIGAVTGAKENTLSKPVAGQKGVFLFDVTSRTKVDNVTPESEKVRLEASAQAYIMERVNQALTEQSKITDNRVKFF